MAVDKTRFASQKVITVKTKSFDIASEYASSAGVNISIAVKNGVASLSFANASFKNISNDGSTACTVCTINDDAYKPSLQVDDFLYNTWFANEKVRIRISTNGVVTLLGYSGNHQAVAPIGSITYITKQ